MPDFAQSKDLTLRAYFPRLLASLDTDPRFSDILWDQLDRGKVFLCLDGLDEVPTQQRRNITDIIDRLTQRLTSSIVVASRPTDFASGQNNFTTWNLKGLGVDQQIELAFRLFAIFPDATTSSISSQVAAFRASLNHEAKQIQTWATNPLLFSLAAVFFASNGSLPTNLALLYRQTADALLRSREPDLIRRDRLRLVVAEVAYYWFTHNEGPSFTREDLRIKVVPRIPPSLRGNQNNDALTTEIMNCGIFISQGLHSQRFLHQSFFEYFAAIAVAQRLVSDNASVASTTWKEVKRQFHIFSYGDILKGLRGETGRNTPAFERWREVCLLMLAALSENASKKGDHIAQEWFLFLTKQWRHLRWVARYIRFISIGSLILLGVLYLWQFAPASFASPQAFMTNAIVSPGALWHEFWHNFSHFLKIEVIDWQPVSHLEFLYFLHELPLVAAFIAVLYVIYIMELNVRDYFVDKFEYVWGGFVLNVVQRYENEEWLKAGDDVLLKRAIKDIYSSDESIHTQGFVLLRTLKPAIALNAVIHAAKNTNKHIRLEAMKTLHLLATIYTIPSTIFVNGLKDSSTSVRSEAAKALISLGVNAPIEVIATLKRDKRRWVRMEAENILNKLQNETEGVE